MLFDHNGINNEKEVDRTTVYVHDFLQIVDGIFNNPAFSAEDIDDSTSDLFRDLAEDISLERQSNQTEVEQQLQYRYYQTGSISLGGHSIGKCVFRYWYYSLVALLDLCADTYTGIVVRPLLGYSIALENLEMKRKDIDGWVWKRNNWDEETKTTQ